MGNIAIMCRMSTKEGLRPAYLEALNEILQDVREEDGTVAYVIHESTSDDNSIYVYELYEDEAAYEAHRSGEAFGRLIGRLGDLLAEPPQLSYGRVVGAKIDAFSIP